MKTADSAGKKTQNSQKYKYRNAVVYTTCFTNRKHPKFEQFNDCIVKTKTNQAVVLQTLPTTFHFKRAFSILVLKRSC